MRVSIYHVKNHHGGIYLSINKQTGYSLVVSLLLPVVRNHRGARRGVVTPLFWGGSTIKKFRL